MKYILRISSQILENPKNFMIWFLFSTGFGQKSFPPEKDFNKIWFTIWNFIFSLFQKHFFPSNHFH